VIDWLRASCIAAILTTPTPPTHASSQVGATEPRRFAAIISAATTLAAAKNGARCAREISWMSRSGELSGSPPEAETPADSPPGSRAEIKRL
jgi:hypothetical protein